MEPSGLLDITHSLPLTGHQPRLHQHTRDWWPAGEEADSPVGVDSSQEGPWRLSQWEAQFSG